MFRTHIFLLGFMLSSSALAYTSADNHFVIGVSAGPTWSDGNQKQEIYLEPDVAKTYTAGDDDTVFPSGELFVGWQNAFSAMQQPFLGQLGISIAGAGSAKLRGDVWEDSDPAFDDFTYKYKVNHSHVAIKGRVVGNYQTRVEPYLSASAGVGFNDAHDFTISSKISEEVPPPGFKSNTTTTFSYTIGVGLQTAITQQLQAALGYEFADWGKVQLSRASGQTINQGLSLDHLYGHQLQFSLFYAV